MKFFLAGSHFFFFNCSCSFSACVRSHRKKLTEKAFLPPSVLTRCVSSVPITRHWLSSLYVHTK